MENLSLILLATILLSIAGPFILAFAIASIGRKIALEVRHTRTALSLAGVSVVDGHGLLASASAKEVKNQKLKIEEAVAMSLKNAAKMKVSKRLEKAFEESCALANERASVRCIDSLLDLEDALVRACALAKLIAKKENRNLPEILRLKIDIWSLPSSYRYTASGTVAYVTVRVRDCKILAASAAREMHVGRSKTTAVVDCDDTDFTKRMAYFFSRT